MSKASRSRIDKGSSELELSPRERELIVIVKPEARLQTTLSGIISAKDRKEVRALKTLMSSGDVTMKPLFGISEKRIKHKISRLAASTRKYVPDLSVYYRVSAPDEKLEDIAQRLRQQELVKAAYVKPRAFPPIWRVRAAPLKEEPPVSTPNFTARQGYLVKSPKGIDARFAWTRSGGKGANVRIVDIEGAWRFTHEDLRQNQGGVVGGTMSTDIGWRDHGTAVVGEFGGDFTPFGITGICPDANVRAISIFGNDMSPAQAIVRAADMLSPGDIILIELHYPGPKFSFQDRADQRGYIAVEWWPEEFDAIRYATTRGIVVVEAAGNGAENLDDDIYNQRPTDFPSDWTNPFNRANRDSGAIIVGAGAPPPGFHGRDHGPDRSRLDFSNYGESIDAQGWGREVTTTSYGDLQGGISEDEWYTDEFSGTSSASPIIVGTLGCIQGILRARRRSPLTPARARELLRETGSLQQDAPGRPRSQRIGNRPNLRRLIPRALSSRSSTHRIKRSKKSKKGVKTRRGLKQIRARRKS